MEVMLVSMFVSCLKLTIPNPYTIHNLPSEQCVALYSYASVKCAKNMTVLIDSCRGQDPICDEEVFYNLVNHQVVCRLEESELGEK